MVPASQHSRCVPGITFTCSDIYLIFISRLDVFIRFTLGNSLCHRFTSRMRYMIYGKLIFTILTMYLPDIYTKFRYFYHLGYLCSISLSFPYPQNIIVGVGIKHEDIIGVRVHGLKVLDMGRIICLCIARETRLQCNHTRKKRNEISI